MQHTNLHGNVFAKACGQAHLVRCVNALEIAWAMAHAQERESAHATKVGVVPCVTQSCVRIHVLDMENVLMALVSVMQGLPV